MKKTVTSLIVAGLLSGCAAGNIKELQSSPANTLHIAIDQNYQRVYKNLLSKMNECMGEAQIGLFAQMQIKHAMFSDLKEANVSYMMTNLGTQSYYLHVDLFGTGDDKTKLDAFVAYSTWKAVLPTIERWATTADAPCELPPPAVAKN